MDQDHWEQIKENIQNKFQVEETGTEDLMMDTQDGLVKQGVAEFMIVSTPMGRIKIASEKRPVVLDKKFIYSHRAGQAGRTEYEFSETEFTFKIKAYKWNEDDEEWKEIDASNFS